MGASASPSLRGAAYDVSVSSHTAALCSADVARPPCSKTARRYRKRGPRSVASRLQRRDRVSRCRADFGSTPFAMNSQNEFIEKCEGVEAISPFNLQDTFLIDCVNVQGFYSKRVELEAYVKTCRDQPDIIALNETFLDPSTEEVCISGYSLISRRDRYEGRGGGIAVFASSAIADNVTLLKHSDTHERSWHTIHSDIGPILFCVWYRPPQAGETISISCFAAEWRELSTDVVGTIVVGDLNVHHLHWLHFSSHTSVEGTALYRFCCDNGSKRCVTSPTRGAHLLDLVLTDMEEVSDASPGTPISDHMLVRTRLSFAVDTKVPTTRDVYLYKHAPWGDIRDYLARCDFSWIDTVGVDDATERLTSTILTAIDEHVPKICYTVCDKAHPWLNDRCLELIRSKHLAAGTSEYPLAVVACSRGIACEYSKYIAVTRAKLHRLRQGSKSWWRVSCELMGKSMQSKGIPALRDTSGNWRRSPGKKAQILADTFSEKFTMPPVISNAYTWAQPAWTVLGQIVVCEEDVETALGSFEGGQWDWA